MKRKMKRAVGLGTGLALAFTLVACGKEEMNTAEHEVYEKDLNRVEEISVPEESTETVTDGETLVSIEKHRESLEAVHSGDAVVEYNETDKAFVITPTSQSFIDAIVHVVNNDRASWETLVDGYADISRQIESDLGQGYSIKMTNPHNYEESIIFIKDGTVLFSS